MKSSLARGDAADVVAGRGDVALTATEGLGTLIDLMRAWNWFSLITFQLGIPIQVEFGVFAPFGETPRVVNLDPATFAFTGLGALGPPLAGLANESLRNPFLGLLVGAPVTEALSLSAGGASLENAWTTATDPLELRYRGAPTASSLLRTALSLGEGQRFGACCLARAPAGERPEPNPECLDEPEDDAGACEMEQVTACGPYPRL